jgi:putative membrane protein
MTVLTLVRAELRRLTATRMAVVAFVALGIVPLLYGGLYLWGNQDPYANLDKIPVALVNADAGTTVDGTAEHYGSSVVTSLVTGKAFAWRTMSATAAAAAVRDGDVDFVVTLPKSFSSDLASATAPTPTTARIVVTASDANNALSTRIAASASESIRASVAKQVGTTAAKQFLVSLADIKSSLSSASSSASTLASGATSTASGAAKVASGTASLSSGSATLASGAASAGAAAKQVASGSASLASGLGTLKSKTASLPAQTTKLAGGAQRVAAGATSVKSGSASLAAGLAKIDAGSTATATAVEQQLAADGLSQAQIAQVLGTLSAGATAVHTAATSAATLASGASSVASGAASVATGTGTLASGSKSLVTGISSASSGASTLASGSSKLASGATTLASGASTLASGAKTAASGASALAAGTTKVAAGSSKLQSALASGAAKIPATTAVERTRQATAIGDPATVATTNIASAGPYGEGLAPFFLSLSAWIGSYALFLILRPLSRRAITAVRRPIRIALAGWIVPAALGVLQVAALEAIVAGPLGFSLAHPIGTFGLLALTAITFAAILLALNAALGSVGQFLGLILMLIQLVTAGGTFPWQTLPAPLAALHHALPMSYAVDALRQTMYGGTLSLAWGDALVLALWLVGALAVTALTAARMTRGRTLRDLQPSLIGA